MVTCLAKSELEDCLGAECAARDEVGATGRGSAAQQKPGVDTTMGEATIGSLPEAADG